MTQRGSRSVSTPIVARQAHRTQEGRPWACCNQFRQHSLSVPFRKADRVWWGAWAGVHPTHWCPGM